MATAPILRHKHLRIDEAKLRKAKRILEAATDTEAVDRALNVIVAEGEIDEVLREIGGKGSLKKAFR